MTKPAPAPKAAPAPAAVAETVVASGDAGFSYDDGLELPERAGFGGEGDNSELKGKLLNQPIGKSFLEEVTVPETITDANERKTAFKEEARRVSNRVSGTIRRLRKDHPERNYAIRTVNDTKMGQGVRVWREADSATTTTAAAPEPAPAAE